MKPLFAVIGTTGVGKSQLSIELSKCLDGEVINGDSMQVYKGYPIITNKVTTEEQENIPHHLLDFLDVQKEYSVVDFEKDALKSIDSIHSSGKTPVLVGGTHYYIQSVIWNQSLLPSNSKTKGVERGSGSDEEYDQIDTNTLYNRLKEIDPTMAEYWHPNNRRKIIRSLKVFEETGKKHSEWIQEQQKLGVQENRLRFPTCIFWLYSEPEKLFQRLDDRVDKMINMGLFDELESMRELIKGSDVDFLRDEEDFSRGIKQAIGFREFNEYFKEFEANGDSEKLSILKEEAVEAMKQNTRKYSKRQIHWIQNKLIPVYEKSMHDRVKLYLLDATDLEKWDVNVREQAIKIAKDFMDGKETPEPTTLNQFAKELLKSRELRHAGSVTEWKKYTCDICKDSKASNTPLIINGTIEWEQHLKSRRHRKQLQYNSKIAKLGYDPKEFYKSKKRQREVEEQEKGES
ncbi:tRNA isopentenyltransferase [Basidiobolus meristosporus CBS 931.73]|uniref:tRNA dimethylallyltransferase n=1 Tax=Basidiobolus meristosporus CBS 931.73 TaxID=1314790 RepID=A0A1Y1XWX9_9FUNG|nr:tRNA isopentenyltransferase [Basidiobolus meristosporus CBS 931.73]|eukprot:ORX90248.1 tRNA isopentenyltransferase [Basidiobolus meristosporus CBS 931.73]